MIQTEEVVRQIIDHLRRGQPYALVRCGDGEANVLNFRHSFKAVKVSRNHLGTELTEVQFREIHSKLVQAFQQANLIGLPYGKYLESRNGGWSNASSILLRECGYLINQKQACSMNIHLDLLHGGQLGDILRAAKKIVLITPHDLVERFKIRFPHLTKISYIHIGGESLYFPNSNPLPHYPEVFNNTVSQLRQMELEGVLVLVGGGFLGKIYCNVAKDQGGVAVDIGSVFDLLAGYKTRSTRHKLIEDDQYKL